MCGKLTEQTVVNPTAFQESNHLIIQMQLRQWRVDLLPVLCSVISAKTHAYNTDNNPFEGFALHCAIDDVFLRGHHAVQDGKLKEEKLGTFIPRGKNTLEAEK